MSHMAAVAEMLGVKIGEEFYIGPFNEKYVIYDKGLYSVSTGILCSDFLIQLLNGTWTINQKPQTPSEGEGYFYIDQKGDICGGYFHKTSLYDINLYKLGNCYRTRKEAELNRGKWSEFYTSDKVLEI